MTAYANIINSSYEADLSEFILWKQLDFYFLFFTEADFESHSNFFLFCSRSSIIKNIKRDIQTCFNKGP